MKPLIILSILVTVWAINITLWQISTDHEIKLIKTKLEMNK